jgi:hypothetical protein
VNAAGHLTHRHPRVMIQPSVGNIIHRAIFTISSHDASRVRVYSETQLSIASLCCACWFFERDRRP